MRAGYVEEQPGEVIVIVARIELNATTAAQFLDRIEALTADTAPLWGTLSSARMLAHMTRTFEMSLSETEVPDMSNVLTRSRFVRWLAFEVMPIPHGIKAPPVFFPESHQEFSVEKVKLISAVQRFIDTETKDPSRLGSSPAFGPMSLSYWKLVHGKHLDHHLRQFGV